ncbi:LOW QUALITY PROTEIN: hypothetical protein Cgig2_020956 [Carnegiea gigantea]|uniref:Uncharacterized protein n=1 Tax=Carnegiea gigantea TaxID=171969 RepID=A0A9Q1GVG3_9CARY|nr:LOW QUALITY PROTEIN: hypothetical protein Cgig2_020956 [Carnegiea gigantea]
MAREGKRGCPRQITVSTSGSEDTSRPESLLQTPSQGLTEESEIATGPKDAIPNSTAERGTPRGAPRVTTFASLFDPDDGTALKFVPPIEVNGQKCAKIECPFLEHIDFVNDSDVVVRQHIEYESKPVQCTHCQMLGHDALVCRKKQPVRQEWRIRPRIEREPDPAAPSSIEHSTQDNETTGGFISPRQTSVRPTPNRQAHPAEIHNSFQGLMEGPLKKLHRDKFADLHEQQQVARDELERVQAQLQQQPLEAVLLAREKEIRDRYIKILQSSFFLVKLELGKADSTRLPTRT